MLIFIPQAKQYIVRLLFEAERFEEANVKAREYLNQHQNDGAFHNVSPGTGERRFVLFDGLTGEAKPALGIAQDQLSRTTRA